ncbi:MAG: nucleotidyl transferase AbiEii/AbiGii toxin family protein [Elusimicrobiota bacterium]
MEDLKKHEAFEMEVLEKLKNAGFLFPLVFVGGTMLRLCNDMSRHSSDIDVWFVRKINYAKYYKNLATFLRKNYTVKDAKSKYFTLLFEIGSDKYPRKLKIELRKKIKKNGFGERIAYSPHSNRQVLVRCLTLEEMMKNKLEAFLDRKEIRDCFDIEFLLRKGIKLNAKKKELVEIKNTIEKFRKTDYSVKLGSLLSSEMRKYYIKNGFSYLTQQINTVMSFK